MPHDRPRTLVFKWDVVAEFLLTSTSRGSSAIAEPLVYKGRLYQVLSKGWQMTKGRGFAHVTHCRRRSRASPVLTAISLVYGNPWFSVITSTTATAVQNLVEIRLWGASGQIGEISRKLFLFIPLFLSNSSTGQTIHHIFTLNGSNDADSRKGVPCLAFVDLAPHFGYQIALKPQFLERE